MSSKDEKEIFEFLDSLGDDGKDGNGKEVGNNSNNNSSGNNNNDDGEILDFLEELENKKETKREETPSTAVTTESVELEKEEKYVKEDPKEEPTTREEQTQTEQVIDPITSIASWWSNTGSTQVSSQLTSLWGTAQKQAEEAIKIAKEQKIDTKQIDELNKGLNKGLSFFNGTINEVFEKINKLNQNDETIKIILIHDMENLIGINNLIKLTFEDVLSQQVDGIIDIKVIENSKVKTIDSSINTEKVNLSMFNGKGSDADKLILANIENEIKEQEKNNKEEKKEGAEGEGEEEKENETIIYLSLLAWTINKDFEIKQSKEIDINSYSPTSFTISCILKDEKHNIIINSQSQPLPLQWAKWVEGEFEGNSEEIDPSDWVYGWIRNIINNLIGVIAQDYVIKRMGY
ncbi:Mtc1 protein [Pichia kluyveri]|uniref:Mtc1 protein n=1 Tax=Pichia kluyveri TaxID=36015 RepID=A0AAV5R146_PICKL|nr:Mtc1 protein [Pichia kluyveri]